MKDYHASKIQKIKSPPGGLMPNAILQSEDHQLLELYQMQTQELLRIAAGSGINSPKSQAKLANPP